MEGVLSNITISEFFPTTMLDEQQSKKIKLQNSSYNNITEKYKRESAKNTIFEFNNQVSQENVSEQSAPVNDALKEPISLPALKDVIELVRYQEAAPLQVGEYRPIKISESMEVNIIAKYNAEENSKSEEMSDNYRINFSDTDVIFKASKKYAGIDSEEESKVAQDIVVAPEREEDVQEENSSNDDTTTNSSGDEKNFEYQYSEEPNSYENSNTTDTAEESNEIRADYSQLIEKLKQERDTAAQRVKAANNSYNETKVKLAEAADKYVAILKEQTATLNHEAESSEQKASNCKEQLETMLAEIDKVNIK